MKINSKLRKQIKDAQRASTTRKITVYIHTVSDEREYTTTKTRMLKSDFAVCCIYPNKDVGWYNKERDFFPI